MRVNLLDLTRIIIATNFCNTHLKINLFHQSGASSKPLCAKIKKSIWTIKSSNFWNVNKAHPSFHLCKRIFTQFMIIMSFIVLKFMAFWCWLTCSNYPFPLCSMQHIPVPVANWCSFYVGKASCTLQILLSHSIYCSQFRGLHNLDLVQLLALNHHGAYLVYSFFRLLLFCLLLLYCMSVFIIVLVTVSIFVNKLN